MFDFTTVMDEVKFRITQGARLSDVQFLEQEINLFLRSKRRRDMVQGELYYRGQQDIRKRQRTIIGENGELESVKNLPNNRIVDNQYKKMVDQKNNYLLGQPLTVQSDNEAYETALKGVFHKRFHRQMKMLGEDSLNCGIAWLYIHYDQEGQLAFRRLNPFELHPAWADEEHSRLDYAFRIYEVTVYEGEIETTVQKVEVYEPNGISYFQRLEFGQLVWEGHADYFTLGDQGYNWDRIPLIPFRYNSKEITLLSMVKSLQDGINTIQSNFLNQMEEDPRNTILVVVNYGGENLGDLRKNLATYGAVHVFSDGNGGQGDVKTLSVEVNSENYKAILELLKKALMENAMGYDAKDDRLGGTPNQMNIQSMYSDIDLDANNMETEYQASFEQLLWFVNAHFYNLKLGDFQGEGVEVIFNRDILINETEAIENCVKSSSLLSQKTIIANHSWVDDPTAELKQKKAEQQEALDQYPNAFPLAQEHSYDQS